MELRIRTDRPEDRLATAIFLAALVHGLLILGLRFSAPPVPDLPLPTLEVLLVPDGAEEPDNPDAGYIAERSQHGSGTARDDKRTSLPESSASLIEHSGEAGGESLEQEVEEHKGRRSPAAEQPVPAAGAHGVGRRDAAASGGDSRWTRVHSRRSARMPRRRTKTCT